MKYLFYQFVRAVMPDKIKHYRREQKLFQCDVCKEVIEIYSVAGKYREAHFTNLPTIHLLKRTCLKCKKTKGVEK